MMKLINSEKINGTELEDFDVLKSIMNGNTKIEDLDSDLRKRLIIMCKDKLSKTNLEIEKIDNNIKNIKELIERAKKI